MSQLYWRAIIEPNAIGPNTSSTTEVSIATEVTISAGCEGLLASAPIQLERIVETIHRGTVGTFSYSRPTEICVAKWFDDGEIVFVCAVATKETKVGGSNRLEAVECQLALKLTARVPGGLLNRHMDGEDILSRIADSFGLSIIGDPSLPATHLYSGPLPNDGLKWNAEPDDNCLILGSMDPVAGKAIGIWVFSTKRYLTWVRQESVESTDKVTFTILNYGGDSGFGQLVTPEGQVDFNTRTTQLTSLVVGYYEVQKVYLFGKRAVFERLGRYVEVDLGTIPDGERFTLGAEWSFDHITIWATYVDTTHTEKHFENTTQFDTTLMPAPIARAIWEAVKGSIQDDEQGSPKADASSLRHFYHDAGDLSLTVANIFREIDAIFRRTRPSAFWNASGKARTPKSEPESGDTLRAFFECLCAYKNMVVSQEDPTRSGDVDFVFTAPRSDFRLCQTVLEIKNAHSDRLEVGLTKQLPLYIEDRRLDVGLYGVLWFKGRWFESPRDETLIDCQRRLARVKPPKVLDVLFLDVSYPAPASKQ